MWSGITSESTRGQPRTNQWSKKDQPGILMWIQGLHEIQNFLIDHSLVHSKIWPDAVNIRYMSMELVPRLSWSFGSSSIWHCIVGWIFVGAATWICDCMLRIAAVLANTISYVTKPQWRIAKARKVMTANQVLFSNIGSCLYISPSATRAIVYLLVIVYGNTLPMIKSNKVYLIIYQFLLTPVMVCLIYSSVVETIHGLIVVWELHPLQILAIVYLNCVKCLI